MLVFDEDGGERSVTRSGPAGEFGVFMHCIPGAAVFTLPTGVDRPLESTDLNLAARHLRLYARRKGEFITPMLAFDGYPLDLGPQIEMNTSDPIAGHRFAWGNYACALLITKTVDPLLNVTTGQVYTYDHTWVDPKPGVLDQLLGRFFPNE